MRPTTRHVLPAAATAAVLGCLTLLPRGPLPAQDAGSAGQGEEVVIRREAVAVRDPKAYQASLHLDPVREVTLVAPGPGTISSLTFEAGDDVNSQAELLRLDTAEQDLLVERAEALLEVANAETGPAAKARVRAAEADLKLAKLRRDRQSVRAPFAGTIFRVHAVEGQPVSTGDRLLTLADTSGLRVEVPVDRNTAERGGTLELKIEDRTASGTVETILPLAERFEPLRELVESAASAVVRVDGGEFAAGQTVYAPIAPREPVAEVPTSALSNRPDGSRMVQVIRGDVVRNLTVRVLGSVGEERAFLSGPFAAGDEVIVESSRELADGTALAAAVAPPANAAGDPGRTRGGSDAGAGAGAGGGRSGTPGF